MRRGVYILLAVVLLLAFIWLGLSSRTSPPTDLFAGFLDVTNNPCSSVYPRLSVIGDGRGLYALFAVTNISRGNYLKFGISAVETQVNGSWRADNSRIFEQPLGALWVPGFGSVYAIPWPTQATLNTPWRLRLWVMREPGIFFSIINQRLGREIFQPRGRSTVMTDAVTPMRSYFTEPSVYTNTAQPERR